MLSFISHSMWGNYYYYVAIETSGTWGEQAIDLVKEIGRRFAEATHEPRSTAFLRQRLSFAVQRCNAFCILGHSAARTQSSLLGDCTE